MIRFREGGRVDTAKKWVAGEIYWKTSREVRPMTDRGNYKLFGEVEDGKVITRLGTK